MRNFVINAKIDLLLFWYENIFAYIYHVYELTVEFIDNIPDKIVDIERKIISFNKK